MNLLAPFSLLLLPLIGGAIILLYLLRLKRRDVTVSSVMLWQTVLHDAQANAPFQKLRRNLLLALQLIATLFLVLILARPFLWSAGLGGKTTALILDASASMNATDERGSRFDEAVRQAETIIRNKGRNDAVAIVVSTEKPEVLAPLTTDSEKLLKALRTAKPTEASGEMREAITFASTLVSSRSGAQVTLLSDGAFGRLDEMALGGATVGQLTVGKRANNVAVTAFDVRDTLSGDEGRQAFVTVQNFSKTRQTVPLELKVGDQLIDAHEVTLAPGETKSETFDRLLASSGGIVSAKLDIKDDLVADNVAQMALPPRRTLKVLLVSEGNVFLERVLNLDTRVTLDRVAPGTYKAEDSASRDLTVFDAANAPKDLPAGRYLFWGGVPGNEAPVTVTSADEANRPQILDWSRTHPLMRFVDLANVKILAARQIAPTTWGQTLAESDDGPLIVAGEKGGTKAVYVGFNATDSDMPLRIAFPIFVTNCVQWLTAKPGDTGGVSRPGEVISLAANASHGAITITRPDGKKDTLPAPQPGAAVVYAKADKTGLYTATGKNYKQTFAVALLSPAESNVTPVPKPAFVVVDRKPDDETTNAPGEKKTGQLRVRREVWPIVALIALVVLIGEWIVYHRRVG